MSITRVPARGRCGITLIIARDIDLRAGHRRPLQATIRAGRAAGHFRRRTGGFCDDAGVLQLLAVFEQFEEWVSSDWSYLVIFVVATLDAFFPLVPSESVAITGGVLAGAGDLSLPLVILAASTGAILGDNISYGIGTVVGERSVKRVFAGNKSRRAFEWAEHQLEQRGTYIIVVARFIPGGRTATTFSAGYTKAMTYRRFLAADVLAGVIWGSYAGLLGYFGGKTFEEQPWKGLLLAFGLAVAVTTLIELVRSRRSRRAAPVTDDES
jgi:membrane protein DedA with SNARE-associated domain